MTSDDTHHKFKGRKHGLLLIICKDKGEKGKIT